MKLEWAELAVADRRSTYDYLDERNPTAAVEMDRAIANAVQRLRD
jgi:plasmid stabilization system protein ParE